MKARSLLMLSRHVLTEFVSRGVTAYGPEVLDRFSIDQEYHEKAGVFVTLKERKGGRLRGCIGTVQASDPIYQAVILSTIASASEDPRFVPVEPLELEALEIEISIMSPFTPVARPEEIVVGEHGVLLRKGGAAGLFLPQVPVEWNWDLNTYLEQLCLKAGLPRTAYKDPSAKLFRFSADVFRENAV